MPDFTKLTTWDIWSAAVEQVFFSMSLGTGALITFGSYSPFRSPTNMDAINMNLIDYGTSLAFGIVMFNCMGAISFDLEIPVEQILEGAKPLLFGVIPESLLYLGEPTFLWSLILYSSLICVGISSSFCLLSSHLEILYGLFPAARGYTIYMSALLSTVVFLQGLVFVTTEGSFFLNSLDNFIAGPVSLVVSIYQSAAVFWIYGVTRFTDDIHFMLGFRPSTYMQASWLASPAVLVAVLVTNLLHWSSQNELLYPRVVGWGVFAALHVAVVGAAAHQALACRRKGNLALVLRPEPEWGPRDATLLKSRRMFSSQAMTKEYMYRQTRAKELSRQKSIAVI
uniref:Uncharacterized protein n=1 Tax=Timema poppense TaxID=170557 RepID=A0A7R9HCY2_TIMPO|nr:unnamed protein product [Timema poppensis]